MGPTAGGGVPRPAGKYASNAAAGGEEGRTGWLNRAGWGLWGAGRCRQIGQRGTTVMARNALPERKARYFRLNSQLALMDNAELRARFDESASSAGWGKNHTLEIGRSKLFVKRVPMTGLEYENMFSTRNLYDLPAHYNYGVGSAGFGVFRELIAHIKTTNWVLQGAISTFPLTFLRQKGIIHFDAHFYNVVTDGERAYLTDFGLVLDRGFALPPPARAFFRRHTDYDYGEVLACLGYLLAGFYAALPEDAKARVREQCGLPEGVLHPKLVTALCDHIEAIAAGGLMKLPESCVACIVRYRSVLALMHEFYREMQRNNRKDTKFPHAELRRRLRDTGFVPAG